MGDERTLRRGDAAEQEAHQENGVRKNWEDRIPSKMVVGGFFHDRPAECPAH